MSSARREIITTRVLDAPRELVWKAWTDPKHVAEWWGPNGFTNTIHEMDVRPDGVWRFIMHGPDGVDYKNEIVFTYGSINTNESHGVCAGSAPALRKYADACGRKRTYAITTNNTPCATNSDIE